MKNLIHFWKKLIGEFHKVRMAVIGSGSIVPFHLKAFRAAGFSFWGIASSPNSISAQVLAKQYNINNYFPFATDLIDSYGEYDCLLIASNSKTLYEYLRLAINNGIPTFVEKPIFLNSNDLKEIKEIDTSSKKIMVGYNRRHYSTIKYLHRKLQADGVNSFRMTVPELTNSNNISPVDIGNVLLNNTVHMLDLFLYLSGAKLKELKITFNRSSKSQTSIYLEYRFARCEIFFGTPGNYEIEARTNLGSLITVKPLEILSEFKGMDVIEPDKDFGIRRYVPREISTIITEHREFKPGFLEQSLEFSQFLQNQHSVICPSIQDAIVTSALALELINGI